MASEYYGLNLGQDEFQVVNGSSTNSTDMEVRVDLTKVTKKSDLIIALEKISNAIIKDAAQIFG